MSYVFPPVGGAGVQRLVKLAKYLPQHGLRPSVLTVSNPSVPVRDDSFRKDLPPDMEIEGAPTLEPGYGAKQAAWSAAQPKIGGGADLTTQVVRKAAALARHLLVPDPQVLWQPAAHLALAQRLRRRRDDVVLISGPPFSQFLLAPLAHASGRVGVVLDYRDEWSTYRTTYEMMGTPLASRVGEWLEPWLLRRARAVTTATEEFREGLLRRFSFLDPARVHAIPNGYDPDDFPSPRPEPPGDKFVLTYAGTIFKLTSARGLLRAIRRLHDRAPDLARHLRVRFLGRIVDTELDAFEGMDALGVERVGYVPHEEVLGALSASHLVACLLDEVPGVESIYPGKVFELMHLGRPILTLAPPGALTRLVDRHGLGTRLAPRDEAGIAAYLEDCLRAFVEGRYAPTLHAHGTEAYHRRALAGRFADVLRDAAAPSDRRRAA